jgi:hypothetical protein
VKRVLALLSCGVLSCAKVLGVSDDPMSASTHLCECPGDVATHFDSKEACAAYIDARLTSAADDAVAGWLDKYEESCVKCGDPVACFYHPPVCKTRGCTQDWQCCSWPEGGTCDVETGTCSD